MLCSATLAFQQTAEAQVFEGNIILSSQGQVDSFPATCGCTTITGFLSIRGTDIHDLSPLGGLTAVGGSLSVWNNDVLPNLDGLSALDTVGGDLLIWRNDVLANLDGLSALATVGGELWVRENPV
ncbi:hypothetical protein RZS08_54200, partial [Arthrospira platensis SPKY1]|nr:hypothetical protein [Arthrospira platensis SPKY1]